MEKVPELGGVICAIPVTGSIEEEFRPKGSLGEKPGPNVTGENGGP